MHRPVLSFKPDSANQNAAAQVAMNSMQKLGFSINYRPTPRGTMYSKFCSVPSSKTPICPSVGWLKDFNDPQTMLDPTFNGKNIVASNNSNWPQLNVPQINRAMTDAETLVGRSERGDAWGKIDQM